MRDDELVYVLDSFIFLGLVDCDWVLAGQQWRTWKIFGKINTQ